MTCFNNAKIEIFERLGRISGIFLLTSVLLFSSGLYGQGEKNSANTETNSAGTVRLSEKKTRFMKTLNRHIKAIKTRNLKLYRQTIVADKRLLLIFSNGKQLSGYRQIVQFHKNWFSEKTWEMDFVRKRVLVTEEMAYVLFKTEYRDIGKDNQKIRKKFLLSLVFIDTKAGWKLIFDQNTAVNE